MTKPNQALQAIKHDGQVAIAIAKNRKEAKLKNQDILWSDFMKRMNTPVKTSETYAEYIQMTKSAQDDIKDVGGFVGGSLKDGRRKRDHVVWRQVITLDIDYVEGDFWASVEMMFGYGCALYSTHKHHPDSPRFRLVIPLKRAVTPEEYVAVSRTIAGDLGIDFFDDTTFQAHRLMYWPSVSSDGKFVFQFLDEPWVDPDELLARYEDWRDASYWPQSSRAVSQRDTVAEKQGAPTEKPGIVGAFCRTYSIYDVLNDQLSDRYTPCADSDRYTYVEGTTSGGLVVYGDGDFAFSHHATDPVSHQLCNAFDLLRIHRFGHLDDRTQDSTPMNKRPSFLAMVEEAVGDPAVSLTISREEFGFQEGDADEMAWLAELERDSKGRLVSNAENVMTILNHDPDLIDRFAMNDFVHRVVVTGDLPWRSAERGEYWRDSDDAGLRNYLSRVYSLKGANVITDAWIETAERRAFHPVKTFLDGLVWDGEERIETLFVHYLGAEDTPYVRAATRKMFAAAVARIYTPGTKFDYCLVLVGPQGVGKSYIIKLLGKDWHSDSLVTVKGKEAYEQLQGVWILEMAELTATKKADVEAVKHFITKTEDTFRVAYGRHNETFKRQCVFFGSTNDHDFLNDPSGNRRFLPITVRGGGSKSLWDDLTPDEVDQVWAEAKHLYDNNESLTLSKAMEREAESVQAAHTQENPVAETIRGYLEIEIPDKWLEMTIWDRRAFLHNSQVSPSSTALFKRKTICPQIIWEELYQRDVATMTRLDAKEINRVLQQLPDWERSGSIRFGPHYGVQKGFRRV